MEINACLVTVAETNGTGPLDCLVTVIIEITALQKALPTGYSVAEFNDWHQRLRNQQVFKLMRTGAVTSNNLANSGHLSRARAPRLHHNLRHL